MGRTPCCDKNGLRKGPWTPEEDLNLINYIHTHGPRNWRALPKNAGLLRCGKSCRLRWTNYLRPDIKRGRFSFEEEEAIIQLHSVMGNKWSAIAAKLPGRTDNEIKNHWNTHIRKRLLRIGIDPVTHSPRLDLHDLSSVLSSALCNPSLLMNMHGLLNTSTQLAPLVKPELLSLAANATLLSLNIENSDLVSQNIQHQINDGNFQVQQNQGNTIPQVFMNQVDQTLNQSSNVNGLSENMVKMSNTSSLGNLISQPNQVDMLESSEFGQFLNNADQNIGYESVLSTPLSTPTSLNSSTDEERETYCSDIVKFEIPESLDISDFL